MNHRFVTSVLLLSASAGFALPPQKLPSEQQSPSSIVYKNEDRAVAVEIKNVAYELVGSGIPGRPTDERLVLRKTTRTKQIVDEIGMEATTTIEAWPLGVDLKEKPLYAMTIPGVDPITMNSNIIIISRGLEEVDWWSVYKMGTGERLFDTYVPLVQFSINREMQTLRYTGLEVPPDDVADRRLRAANVIAVLTYASPERVIREALITCDDSKLARVLRSYVDANRSMSFVDGNIRLSISQNYPSPPKTITITVPINRDDLDLSRGQIPAGFHVAAWKR
jgi:hypothetical protein